MLTSAPLTLYAGAVVEGLKFTFNKPRRPTMDAATLKLVPALEARFWQEAAQQLAAADVAGVLIAYSSYFLIIFNLAGLMDWNMTESPYITLYTVVLALLQTAQLVLILLNRPLYIRWRLYIMAMLKAVSAAFLYDAAVHATVARAEFQESWLAKLGTQPVNKTAIQILLEPSGQWRI
jgi:hypothetical protein